ncbi:two-component sensor histidine kinase, partial [bacterium]
DFDRMAERLETLVESQRRLLADISHELRSPLARLAVASELAQQDAGPAAQPSLQRIDMEANRMNELIAQLLTFTRLENGLANAEWERFNLASLVQEIAANADFEAIAQQCRVTAQTPSEAWMWGSLPLTERAIENVVRNAVRYTLPGTQVDVHLACSPTFAVLTVHDHGPGVPEEFLSHLCDPFYRVDGARNGNGVGLGLSISKRAVETHGGELIISNGDQGGLVVEIQLPLSTQTRFEE